MARSSAARVDRAAPDGLHLHVAHALQVDIGVVVIQIEERPRDGDRGGAAFIELRDPALGDEAIEGRDQFGVQFRPLRLAHDARGFRDDEIGFCR